MRIISEFETQFKLGQSSLSKIKLDYTSRDDITKLLLGIQSISLSKEGQTKIFQILEKTIIDQIDWSLRNVTMANSCLGLVEAGNKCRL